MINHRQGWLFFFFFSGLLVQELDSNNQNPPGFPPPNNYPRSNMGYTTTVPLNHYIYIYVYVYTYLYTGERPISLWRSDLGAWKHYLVNIKLVSLFTPHPEKENKEAIISLSVSI